MKTLTSSLFVLFTCLLTTSCSTIQKQADNKPVRLIFYNELNIISEDKAPTCRYLGEIIGSEGHWYSYLFITNTNLTQGALNDIYNKANDLGANTVYIDNQIPFATSVTFYGQAYSCNFNEQ